MEVSHIFIDSNSFLCIFTSCFSDLRCDEIMPCFALPGHRLDPPLAALSSLPWSGWLCCPGLLIIHSKYKHHSLLKVPPIITLNIHLVLLAQKFTFWFSQTDLSLSSCNPIISFDHLLAFNPVNTFKPGPGTSQQVSFKTERNEWDSCSGAGRAIWQDQDGEER